MASTKLYDVAVRTGTYIKDGAEKGRYEQVGSMWRGDNGDYLVMKRTFNPAGAPHKDGSDSIFLSLFSPKDDNRAPANTASRTAPAQDLEDNGGDIPF